MARKFPSYTTANLKQFIECGVTDMRSAEKLDEIKLEVADREHGVSTISPTPQVDWASI